MTNHTDLDLKSLRVLVTRPSPLGEILCEAINEHNGEAIYFATVEMVPLADSKVFINQIKYLSSQDWLIFISPMSVYFSEKQIHQHWPTFPANVKVAAIGGGTAQTLQKLNLPVDVFPEDKWSSEGLLELPAFADVENKRIAVVSGDEGREWLIDTLKIRGAKVTHMIAFQRAYPIVDVTPYLDLIRNNKIDIILVSFGEGLKNLVELLEEEIDKLIAIPLVVVSERLMHLAQDLGFEKIILASNANVNSYLAALQQFVEGQ